jgi:hypothetical protein
MYKLTARQLLFTRTSTLLADYADSVTTLLRQTVLNVQQQSDKLRAELEEGHEHYIEILAKYCAANERAEQLQAQLSAFRDVMRPFAKSVPFNQAALTAERMQARKWMEDTAPLVKEWLSRKLAESKQEALRDLCEYGKHACLPNRPYLWVSEIEASASALDPQAGEPKPPEG